MYKIGLDIHGVIDKHPDLFSILSKEAKENGWEVHILTGPPLKRKYRTHRGKFDTIEEELESYNIFYDNIFSIVSYNLKVGSPNTVDSKGNFWFEEEVWNKTKSIYCKENDIDILIDDTEVYGDYFHTPFAYLGSYKNGKSFLNIKNKVKPKIFDFIVKHFRGEIVIE